MQFYVRSSRAIRVSARIWTYTSTTPGQGYIGATYDKVVSSGVVLQPNQWTQLNATITPFDTVVSGRIIVQAAAGAGQAYWQPGDTFDIDSIMLSDGAGPYQYADGNSENWAWSEAENHSPSSGPPL